jgi:hypothetical protein
MKHMNSVAACVSVFLLSISLNHSAFLTTRWYIHFILQPHTHALVDVPMCRKKMFRSSRTRDLLIIKFSSEDVSSKWRGVLEQEINVDRCKVCLVVCVVCFVQAVVLLHT